MIDLMADSRISQPHSFVCETLHPICMYIDIYMRVIMVPFLFRGTKILLHVLQLLQLLQLQLLLLLLTNNKKTVKSYKTHATIGSRRL